MLSIAVGTRDISLATAWRVLWEPDGSTESVIIHDLRIPRALLGVVVGAATGLAGALMQALTRNPLADPGLFGVNMGASAAIVVGIAFLGVSSISGYVWFAFAGAAAASVGVYLLGSSGRSSATPERLALAGAAMTAVLYAFISAVMLLNIEVFNKFRFWNVGSLVGRDLDVLWQVLPFLVVGLLITFGLARPLNALALGEQAAASLGARVGLTRVLGAVAVMLLCGASTAAIGPIAFVGLAVPHAARLIVGPDQRWVLPYSMVLAAILLLGSDVVGRLFSDTEEVQVGIVTAIIGAPVFILLCRRRKLARL
ncbi:Fe(3+)-siderophore ABC transporter permease [Amycolatopsis suaedae]|uniref:Fe(3+)-siderophore ABC transporter permease n=2 Tax=Amycolatopsis suaedae TaxID=2510978 RepID=A0A4Q7JCR0_9PSEU|nr:Fe(3+)-siderophore ABC transporter permease [Amycolatopsis suaedae]